MAQASKDFCGYIIGPTGVYGVFQETDTSIFAVVIYSDRGDFGAVRVFDKSIIEAVLMGESKWDFTLKDPTSYVVEMILRKEAAKTGC